MALSQMGVPDYTSGSDSVYLCSADLGITEINATDRYNWTKTSYCPVEPHDRRCVGHLSAKNGHFTLLSMLPKSECHYAGLSCGYGLFQYILELFFPI